MAQPKLNARLLAVAVVLSLQAPLVSTVSTLAAEPPTALITGVLRSATDHSPMAGARLLVSDRKTGEISRSDETGSDGSFVIADLNSGEYDLAVEVDGGLFVIRTPIYLVGGVKRTVQIAVGVAETADATEAKASAWDNPAAAGAMVLGLAILVGAAVKNLTEDEVTATGIVIVPLRK